MKGVALFILYFENILLHHDEKFTTFDAADIFLGRHIESFLAFYNLQLLEFQASVICDGKANGSIVVKEFYNQLLVLKNEKRKVRRALIQ